MRSVVLGVIALASVAHADDVEKVFKKQLISMNQEGRKDFEATLQAGKPLVLISERRTDTNAANLVAPPSSGLAQPIVKTKVVGKNGKLTWIVADLVQPFTIGVDCPMGGPTHCQSKRPLRVTELFVDGKVQALHVDSLRMTNGMVDEDTGKAPTSPSPLAKLLVDPKGLKEAFLDDPNIVLIGTDLRERAVGPAAVKKLLDTWKNLKLELRDLDEGTDGVILATVIWKQSPKKIYTMRATLFYVTLPDKTKKVVVAHYSFPANEDVY